MFAWSKNKLKTKEHTVGDKYLRFGFDRVIIVEKLITVFYMEFSKNFAFEGESHDFWELVYVDRGEILCTGGERSFVLKAARLRFTSRMNFIRFAHTVKPRQISR
jgi:hypothetical protein